VLCEGAEKLGIRSEELGIKNSSRRGHGGEEKKIVIEKTAFSSSSSVFSEVFILPLPY